MKPKELKRLYREWEKSRMNDDRAAWRCYGLNTSEDEYRWELRLAYISFVRGYELAIKELKNREEV